MKVILSNNAELNPTIVTGGSQYVHGANRDTLTFVFPGDADMEDLDAAFIADNCGSIVIEDDEGNRFVHSGYAIRAELSKKSVEVSPATGDAAAVFEARITVAMAQRTYTETQLASLTETVDVLVMESLMA